MWAVYALLSAAFAGTNAVLAKFGSDKTSAVAASAVRTTAVLAVSSLAMVIARGTASLASIDPRTVIVLTLSAAATAAAWVCYFRALAGGDVDRVSAVDKLSTVLALSGGVLFFGEGLTVHKIIAILLITSGVWWSCGKKSNRIDKFNTQKRGWLVWAMLSAGLVAASTLLSKAGIGKISPEAALVARTGFVLIFTWAAALVKKEAREIRLIGGKTALILLTSGVLTGLGWLCYFRALAGGSAGEVHAVDKLSILVTVVLSRIVFREKRGGRYLCGLVLIVAGILWLYFTSDCRMV